MPQPKWLALALEGVRWRKAGQPARAIECLKQSIEITRQLPDLSKETRTQLNYLADVYLQEGLLDQAEFAIRQALKNRFGLPAADQTLAADDFMIIAKVLSKQGRHREALEAGSHGLAMFKRDFASNDPFFGQIKRMVQQLRQNLAQAKASNPHSVLQGGKDSASGL
jgi:tetratricopeptide (TPR) repeat protein